jgi:large subunit ribosomal protein L20
MARVKGGPKHARKRKRILKRASGFVGQPGSNYRSALEFTRRADRFAYEHRKVKKRLFRELWIVRLSAALRARGINYSRFIPALLEAGVELNRKMLSDLAIVDIKTFDAIVEKVRPFVKTPVKKVAQAA